MQFLCSFKNYELLSQFERLQRITIDSATLFTSLMTKPVEPIELLGPFQPLRPIQLHCRDFKIEPMKLIMHPLQLDHLSKFDKLNSFNESRKILHFFALRLAVFAGLVLLASRID